MNMIEDLYHIHYQDIFHYVLSRVENADVAQDITQETFVRACDHLHVMKQQDKGKVKAWLLTVARNICIDHWRKIQKSGANINLEAVHFSEKLLSENDPLQSIESKEIKKVIQTAINLLKSEHQQAICFFDLNQLSYKESANLLGISEAAFASLLKRARKALIHELIKMMVPGLTKENISEREMKKLVYWFDILDFPINLEEKVSYKSRDFFNGFNERFASFRKESYPEGLNDYLISTAKLDKHQVAADIGCGLGNLTITLSPHVKKVYAVDHSSEMLKILSKKISEKQLFNIYPILADITLDSSFPTEAFDVGFCCMVLHHIYDPKAVLEKIAKVVTPGGHLIIADLAYTKFNWKFKESHDFWSGFKLIQMSRWLEDSGFKVLQIEENEKYRFKFAETIHVNNRVEVPLLFAHCVRQY
nr:sigma-70 family RNA polymerase sigma factor [uncultured Bacillus sp.]